MPDVPHPSREVRENRGGQLVAFPGKHRYASPSSNLPLEPTSFIGRGREVAEVKELLADHRLLTLTGSGGSGKTRIALAVAHDLAEVFEDGVWWVELAPISDPELMPQAVAEVLMIREEPGRSLMETLVRDLGSTELLLVLDNCEHLVASCAALSDALLRSCPRVRLLATSREALGIGGENAWLVPSLSLPDPERPPAFESLASYEAVSLFVERARDVVSAFELTEHNAPAVAKMCRMLDGIPLAIELAAARVRVLSVEQISSRLESTFTMLTGGSRMAMPRQRTLRAAIDWSYELLSEKERVLFRRLAVFAGGYTLEAAEAVCAGEHLERGVVLEVLTRLVEKSLVMVVDRGGATRYKLLETVRQYGWEKLEESGELDLLKERHAEHYLALAEEAEPKLKGPEQRAWLERLELEHDNLRAALGWALARGEAELGLQLAGALGEFWQMRGHLSEGRSWLQAALEGASEASEPARARALAWAGWIAWEQGDYERSVTLSEESLALSRKIGDETGAALALMILGLALMRRGDEVGRASAALEEAVALQRANGNTAGLARSLLGLGIIAILQHDYERAAALHEEGLALARQAADDFAINVALMQGALVCLSRGEHRRAKALSEEGLALAWRLRMLHPTAAHLNISAALAASERQAIRSARLWGAAETLRETIGAPLSPVERSYFAPHTSAVLAELGEASWDAARAEGRAMTPEQAIEYALETEEAAAPSPEATAPLLSERELEVLRLVAEGLTDPQVAQRLYVSPRTVGHHLGSIYRKLGVPSRAAAVAAAVERGLI